MEWVSGSLGYIVPFLLTLTVLVFVHELGHYLVARRNGVRIEVFSIGFGPELFGWNDRAGTRWKFSMLPLGGYVRMFGDADAMSTPGDGLRAMTESERAVSFHHKRLPQRAAVVAAGPIANFLFAILLLAGMFMIWGQPVTRPELGGVEPGSPAARAGLRAGDLVVSVDGKHIDRFEDLISAVQLNLGSPLQLQVRRGAEELTVAVTPQLTEQADPLGNKHEVPEIGIRPPYMSPEVGQVERGSAAAEAGMKPGDLVRQINDNKIEHFEDISKIVQENRDRPLTVVVRRDGQDLTLNVTPHLRDDAAHHRQVGVLGISHNSMTDYVKRDPLTAVWQATDETWNLVVGTLKAVWQMILGQRSSNDLSSFIGIAKMSGQFAQGGIHAMLWFTAMLSVNLGLINLFPIPVLDGGHLLFYAAEAIRGKPLGQRAQEYGFRVGLALVLTLMVFATWNDLVRLGIGDLLKGLKGLMT